MGIAKTIYRLAKGKSYTLEEILSMWASNPEKIDSEDIIMMIKKHYG